MVVNKPQRSFSLLMANSVHFTMEKKEVEAVQLGEGETPTSSASHLAPRGVGSAPRPLLAPLTAC